MSQFNHLPFENPNLTKLVTHLHDYLTQFGYQHIQVPAIGEASTFLQKAGDQITSNLVLFERFGKELALRPEFTALAVQRYVQEFSRSRVFPVVRWQMYGSVFLDRSFDFRKYQHMSLGAELIGMDGILADAEILACAVDSLKTYTDLPMVISVGHVRMVETILSHYGINGYLRTHLLNHLASTSPDSPIELSSPQVALDENVKSIQVEKDSMKQLLDLVLDASEYGGTMGGRTRSEIAMRLSRQTEWAEQLSLISKVQSIFQEINQLDGSNFTVFHDLHSLLRRKGIQADDLLEEWEATLKTAQTLGLPLDAVQIIPLLTHNWNYYTGIVFNVKVDGRLVVSGGRYDDLCKLLGAPFDIPAVGFAYFMDELTHAVGHQQDSSMIDVALLVDTDSMLSWGMKLRQLGWVVSIYPKRTDRSPIDPKIILEVSEDGSIQYGGQSYSLNTIAELALAVENTYHNTENL